MKTYGLNTALPALILAAAASLQAQPTAKSTSFNFTYQVNSTTLPTPGKLTATASKTTPAGYTLTASVSPPQSWLTVTPGGGGSPLALTVTVNPTGLSPGSYSGTITLGTNPGTSTTLVPVTLSVANPPSSISVTPAASVTNFTPGVSGAEPSVGLQLHHGTTGALPASAELDVFPMAASFPSPWRPPPAGSPRVGSGLTFRTSFPAFKPAASRCPVPMCRFMCRSITTR